MSGFKVEFSVLNLQATPGIYASSLATRPAAGQPGRVFIDTDNPSSGMYRDTGTAWVQIAGTGGGGGGTLQTVTDAGNTTTNRISVGHANTPVSTIDVRQSTSGLNNASNWTITANNNPTIASGATFGTNYVNAIYGAQTQLFLQNATIGNSGLNTAGLFINTLQSNAPGSPGIITVTQASTIRAISGTQTGIYYGGTNVGVTYSHVAALKTFQPINTGSAATVTNNYGIIVADSTPSSGSITYTNRWGVYQEGANDNNYFAGKILVNTTTVASFNLDVNGTGRYQTNSGTVLQIGNTTASSVSNPANINLGGTYGITPGNVNNIKLAILDIGTPSILYGIGVSANTLEIHSQSDFAFYNGVATTRTKLINISSTGYTLVVNGSAELQANSGTVLQIGNTTLSSVSNPANINLGGTYGNNTPGNVNNIKLAILDIGTPSNLYGIGVSANLLEFHSQSDFAFYNGISTNRTERMRITSGGDVGIGTTSPAYKLDVTGDIRSTTSAYFATSSGSVGINTTSVNAASLLQMDSTTKGFLLPRMTDTQINAISNPPDGLMVYSTTQNHIAFYDAGATTWKKVSNSNL